MGRGASNPVVAQFPAPGGAVGAPVVSARGAGGGSLLANELLNPAVQAELKLTEAQLTALRDIPQPGADPKVQEAMQKVFQQAGGQSVEERQEAKKLIDEVMQHALLRQESALANVLEESQFNRLRQIVLREHPEAALLRDDVAGDLKLTAEQRQQIQALRDEMVRAQFEKGFRMTPAERAELSKTFVDNSLALLTPEQNDLYVAAQGAPFAVVDRPASPAVPVVSGESATPATGTPATGTPVAGTPMTTTPMATSPATTVPTGTPPMPTTPPAVAGTPATTAPTKPLVANAAPNVDDQPVTSFGDVGSTKKLRDLEVADITFNFRYAQWSEVLDLFATRAGLSLDMNVVPAGTFSYYDDEVYTPTQALDVLNGYLLPKGYALVRRNRFLVCVPIDEKGGIPPNLIPNVTIEELAHRGANELVNVLFPLKGVKATDTAKEIEKILGPQGKVVGLDATNSLLVTDIGGNVRRVQRMLDAIDIPIEGVVFKSYRLEQVAAEEAENSVRAMLGLSVGTTNISAGAGGDNRGFDPRAYYEQMRRMQQQPGGAATAPEPAAQVAVDTRTNSLLVTASPAQQKIVEDAIKVLDVEQVESVFARNRKPYLSVYSVTNANPQEVVKTLAVLVPGVVVNEDNKGGKIHIVATEEQHREIEGLVRQLDGLGSAQQISVIPLVKMDPLSAAAMLRAMFYSDGDLAPTIEADLYGRQILVRGDSSQLLAIRQMLSDLGEDGTGKRRPGDGGQVRKFPLASRDPEEILPLLERSWNNASETPIRIIRPVERGPIKGIISPTREGRTPPAETSTPHPLEEAIRQPVPATPSQDRPETDPSVRLQFPSRNRQQLVEQAPLVAKSFGTGTSAPRQEFRSSASGKKSLIVRYASQQTEVAPQSAAVAQNTPPQPESTATAVDTAVAPQSVGDTPPPSTTAETGTSESKTGNGVNSGDANATDPDVATADQTFGNVAVTVVDGELMLMSTDEEALDRVEDLLSSILEVVPPRQGWTIFPLQMSDATSTAEMLKQLFPDSTVASADTGGGGLLSSLTGGMDTMASSIFDMTGLNSTGMSTSLTIIPYIPQNALFISGPPHKIRDVSRMLEVLDTDELSESLRDRKPRMIPVEHADVEDVYTMVKEIYHDSLESEQDRGARSAASMMAAVMGGGGRGGRGQQQPAQSTPAARLALSIDRQNNQLIVSAGDSLYQEVKSLVESIDKTALDARRSVRIISLQNTSPSMITNTLGSLMPKVKVSTTGNRNRSGSSGSGSTGSGSSSGSTPPSTSSQPNQDQIRQMFEQRMRERMQMDAAGAAPPSGGPTGGPGGGRTGGAPGGGTGRTRGGR
ncbi:MAG: secretin N-terminal domain-containing protein [Planctomycetaceae bacterium]